MVTREVLVQSILKAERQWTRKCRIAHAKLRIAEAVSSDDREIWSEVLKRNGEINERKPADNRRRNKKGARRPGPSAPAHLNAA